MVLSNFDNMLKTISNDRAIMSNGNSFNVVRDLMTLVSAVQNMANVAGGNDMLSMSLMGKISELESIISIFGPQRLAAYGINAGGMAMGGVQPFMPGNPMQNQSFVYPTMGQQMYGGGYAQPAMAPPMQAMPHPSQHVAPAFPTEHAQSIPMNPQQSAPMPPQMATSPELPPSQMVASPPSFSQNAGAPPPTSQVQGAPSFSGSSLLGGALPASLPGAGNGAGDKPAIGRDYLLKLLDER